VHLRAADPLADLLLREVLAEPQVQHLALALVQHGAELLEGDPVIAAAEAGPRVLDRLVPGGAVRLVVVCGRVERRGGIAVLRLDRLEDRLQRLAQVGGDVCAVGSPPSCCQSSSRARRTARASSCRSRGGLIAQVLSRK
jgi:hypothetical protein